MLTSRVAIHNVALGTKCKFRVYASIVPTMKWPEALGSA